MKKIVPIIVCLVFSLISAAQKRTVAVYVTDSSQVAKLIRGKIFDAFVQNNKYVAVERTEEFLAEILRAKKYDELTTDFQHEGERLPVDFVCVIDISYVFEEYFISARLIDAETMKIVNSDSYVSYLYNLKEVDECVSKLAGTLIGKTASEKEHDEKIELAKKMRQDSIKAIKEKEEQLKKMRQDSLQKANNQKESNRLQKAIDKGYIEIDNLMFVVTQNPPALSFSNAKNGAKKCRLGGFSNWRLPMPEELTRVFSVSKRYKKANSNFPNYENKGGFWSEGKCVYKNGVFKRQYGWDADDPYYVIYVRDVK